MAYAYIVSYHRACDGLMVQYESVNRDVAELIARGARDAGATDVAIAQSRHNDEIREDEEQTTETETVTETEEMKEEETMFNSYIATVTEDAVQYIRDNYSAEEIVEAMQDRDEFAQRLNDDMWVADEVTGNASGSYTFNAAEARECVLGDVEQVLEAVREFCCGMDAAELLQRLFNEEWEYFDVTARCYVLGQAIEAALDQIAEEM